MEVGVSSYKAFYQLAEEPFAVTPDPRFLFEARQHRDALREVLHVLEAQRGIMLIIGEVGTGKTTLCRALLQVLPPQYKIALLLNPLITEEDLVRAIVEDLGIRADDGTMSSLMRALETFLLRLGEQGECAVVLLDEAQQLSPAVLERLRLLSNFESSTRKLLQVILMGQTELEEKLQRYELRPLNQRIAVRIYLRPLSRRETRAYIEHRLRRAGLRGPIPFARAALRRIRRFSRGTPRLINLVCDRALFLGHLTRTVTIGRSLATAAIAGLRPRRSRSLRRKVATAVIGGLALAASAGTAVWWSMGGDLSRTLALVEVQSSLPSMLSVARETTPEKPPAVAPQDTIPEAAGAVVPPQHLPEPQEPGPVSPAMQLPATGFAYQLSGWLALWGVREERPEAIADWPAIPDGFPGMRVLAARYGLEAVFFETIAWDDIDAIGLPLLAKIGQEESFSLLVRFAGDQVVVLSAAGTEEERPRRALLSQPFRSAWFLWRNPDGWALVPPWEWSGRQVALLALRLHGLGYLSYPLPALYDSRFSEAARRFQQEVGLKADGIIGPRTALVLARRTDPVGGPMLYGARTP